MQGWKAGGAGLERLALETRVQIFEDRGDDGGIGRLPQASSPAGSKPSKRDEGDGKADDQREDDFGERRNLRGLFGEERRTQGTGSWAIDVGAASESIDVQLGPIGGLAAGLRGVGDVVFPASTA